MKAIVLSGGGSKGSYQIGVWRALRKLHIKYDIVTGTSVGALNGALMVQNKFHKAIKLWSKINMQLLFGDEATNSTKITDVLNMYRINFFKNGGMDVKILEDVIDKYIDKDTFYNSKIDFGLVAVNLSGKKAVQMKKKDIPKDKLNDYLMASASCYPAFQKKDIDGNKFIDGGIFDNMPINLAIDLGADSIIAVDLCAPGVKARPKKHVDTITIKPNNKLTNFLNFYEEGSIRNIKFGYNDTMKVFGKYKGYKYTFKKKNIDEAISEYHKLFIHNLNQILNSEKLIKLIDVNLIDQEKLIIKTAEEIGLLLEFDETKIYKFRKFNKKLLKEFKKNKVNSKKISTIKELYEMMLKKDYKLLRTTGILHPKEFIEALYLYTISEV
ncbi:MAG: patatin-like phospholipase family protein [bacterium]|nr:patatin-like phospholipase family protein [bacterium]